MINEIFVGTTNPAKISQIRGAMQSAGINVQGVKKEDLPIIVEDGSSASENARKKAVAFACHLGKTVISMDNALYLEGLPSEKQPGLNVRRIPGGPERPTDQDLIVYYTQLINSLGMRVHGHWEFGFCIANPVGRFEETTIISPRIFVNQPSTNIEEGYPLESIQIDPETQKIIADMTQEEKNAFWQRAIGEQLLKFVSQIDL